MRVPFTIHQYGEVQYVRLSELPLSADERDALTTWLHGQTVPLIPGVPLNDIMFAHDYDRWRHMRRTGLDYDWD